MRIKIHQYEFVPSQLMVFFAMVFFCLFVLLGNWQLQRAEVKRDIQQRYQAQLNQPYRYWVLEHEPDESLVYRKISLKGAYMNDRILLVDNQLYQGQAGYHVLVPFMIEGTRKVLLVNRGWMSLGYDREQLPLVREPKVPNQVQGIVTLPTTEGFRMGEVAITHHWPQRIPYIDIDKIQQGLDFRILPYVVWLSPDIDDYYVRDWKPVWSPPEKSEAYAVQWFSFALIVLVLFVALNTRKINTEENNDTSGR
ncbi:MAG: SURF1 family protein [Gammaproteobacteria bacterium]|nr:SURF1 family protein [Gammaproteobacteria bacterium]